jgi:flagellin-like protein
MPKIQNRKAVAPIIATLLLVAIAVVGGIIVFVWASGIFGSTAGMALPTAESIQLVGYDARDIVGTATASTSFAGFTTAGPGTATAPGIANGQTGSNNKLAAGSEYVVLKLRNTGTSEILINKVTIMGVDSTWDSDAPNATLNHEDNEPAAGTFEVYTKLSTDIAPKSTPSIAPGEDLRIAVKLSASLPDDIGVGRNLQMKIKTEQGATFNFFLVTGQTE